MAERVEKYVPKTLIDFIEDGKWWIKRITTQRESLAETMDSCKEDALMFYILGDELSKIRKMILNMEKIKQTYEQKELTRLRGLNRWRICQSAKFALVSNE